ncbi:unnamed protein product [Adineta steineri]|uniref:Uncharacterized protein n=1 Tax=Adineta steineri TaxID=433720 RepID=A0A815VIE8_9BILA|nr:unnamed protein product [Adineta steineri]
MIQELFHLLTGEQTANDNESLRKIIPHLTDSNADVELEWFLNAKFGAQTNNKPLCDWFIETFKQSSNTLL